MTDGDAKPTCFIAMPITTREVEAEAYGDPEHWVHVRESLFVPAVEAAGYKAERPEASGAYLIHDMIVKQLETADLVLVDLSAHNPNVFFELGVRTSLNKPIALVWDKLSKLPFDTSGINTHGYDSTLAGWRLDDQRQTLTRHITASAASCEGTNPLWERFGLQSKARQPEVPGSVEDARVTLLQEQVEALTESVKDLAAVELFHSSSDRAFEPAQRPQARPSSLDMNVSRAELIDRVMHDPQLSDNFTRLDREFLMLKAQGWGLRSIAETMGISLSSASSRSKLVRSKALALFSKEEFELLFE